MPTPRYIEAVPNPLAEAAGNFGNAFGKSVRQNQESDIIKRILEDAKQDQSRDAVADIFSAKGLSPETREHAGKSILESKKMIEAVRKEKQKIFETNRAAEKSRKILKRQRELLATGHIGSVVAGIGKTGRDWGTSYSKDASRNIAEYRQAGKALVQAAAPLVIRNRTEFEHYARDLEDSRKSKEEIEGILNTLESMVEDAIEQGGGSSAQEASNNSGSVQMTDSSGKVYNIPKEEVEAAMKDGLKVKNG